MKELNIELLYNYILLTPVEVEDNVNSSGLIISKDDSIGYGEIVAIGRGRLLEDGTIKPLEGFNIGDKVMYKKGGDNIVTIDKENYILIGDVAIIMIMK